MNFYVRKLNAQELGYRNGIPRGAGKYILVSKKNEDFFPDFDEPSVELDEEPSISIGIVNTSISKLVYCEYVWHTKSKHIGKDKRIYLNTDVDPANSYFNLNDYAVFYKYKYEESFIYIVFKFNAADKNYEYLENITEGVSHSWHEKIDFIDTKNIKFNETLLSDKTKDKHKRRGESNNDSTCASQDEFKNLIRINYNNKCAVRNSNINIMSPEGKNYSNLRAAHIMPDVLDGPLRADNGILLSQDLHWAFDFGGWTMSDDKKIIVHPKLLKTELNEFNGKKIFLPLDDQFHPGGEYIKFHRDNIYGRLKPMRKN